MAKPDPSLKHERRRLRRLRESLSPAERRAAERAIAAALRHLRILRPGRRIAAYLAAPGEVDLRLVISAAHRARVTLYVPRITSLRRREMEFVRLEPAARLERNAYGLAQPVATSAPIDPRRLDCVLLPVLGFDAAGNRLGMGAGFYDRSLRHRARSGRGWRRPRLVGIAFSCQQLPAIESAAWDVPLDLVVTEKGPVIPSRAREEPR
jgi:5-formyltetrahydrofolate cyclo-ligase